MTAPERTYDRVRSRRSVSDRRAFFVVGTVICPILGMTFARFRAANPGRRMPGMDTVSMVILAISALALLEVAAANLRGEVRHHPVRRTPAPRR